MLCRNDVDIEKRWITDPFNVISSPLSTIFRRDRKLVGLGGQYHFEPISYIDGFSISAAFLYTISHWVLGGPGRQGSSIKHKQDLTISSSPL